MNKHSKDSRPKDPEDCFDKVRGKADIKWGTDDLMVLLRGDDADQAPESNNDAGAIRISD
ncbi:MULTISPECIES: hypothetical protein [unclassified Pseudomonas]|uniref:hypothetical protein n=1 Tax=unclassified Pseudomonas TaxID=196821 RepID=UPI000A1FD8AA|nr:MULTISPECIES: hypothetical protein [unclassified Pseudomonas]MDI2141871.1 hypothetical protein [Pseudomonas sp. ITA]